MLQGFLAPGWFCYASVSISALLPDNNLSHCVPLGAGSHFCDTTAFITLSSPQVSFAQAQQARRQAESKYLVDIDKNVGTLKDYSQIDALTSTAAKLQYGHRVCQYLNEGMTLHDLVHKAFDDAVKNSEFNPGVDATCHDLMQSSAILYLCPEYKRMI